MTTDGWVDDAHLRALGRVVVAAAWLETVLDHAVRTLVDDGPSYDLLVAGQGIDRLCQNAVRFAERVVIDPQAVEDLKRWTQDIKEAQRRRSDLIHAEHLVSEEGGGPDGRALVVSLRPKRGQPGIELSASVDAVLDVAARFDALSQRGAELTGRLLGGYRGR